MEVEQNEPGGVKPHYLSACVVGAFLQKLAKHLALLACFMIIGGASGRFALSEIGIFLLVVAAAVLHSSGRAVESRLSLARRLPRLPP